MKTFLTILLSLLFGVALGNGFTQAKFENNMKKLACTSTYDDNADIVDCMGAITSDNIIVFERNGLARMMGE